MTPTVVTPPAAAPPVVTPPPAAPPAVPDATALQARITALEQQAAEATRAAEFWHGKANATPVPKDTKPTDEEETGVDILELAMDPKKFNKYLKNQIEKQGYVKKSDAEEMVNSRAGQLLSEANLLKRYPGLDKEGERYDKEMFELTAGHYGSLVKRGVTHDLAMEMGADRAALELIRQGKMKTPAQEKEAKEADRLARVAAQAGSGGGRGTGSDDETDTTLSDHERRAILGIMRGEVDDKGKPLNDDQLIERYTHRAQKIGVAMTPRSTRKAA